MLLLRDHGTMRLRDILEPAIYYAEQGHPLLPRVASTIEDLKAFFETEWPSSAAVYLPGGEAPKPRQLFR
jgi:gamma-glutamyltranspeptidase/glutathione hydrolase